MSDTNTSSARHSTPPPATSTVTVYPTGGEAVTVYTRDFASAEQAATTLREALDAGAAFTIGVHHPDEPNAHASVTLLPANIALIQVHAHGEATTGQYL